MHNLGYVGDISVSCGTLSYDTVLVASNRQDAEGKCYIITITSCYIADYNLWAR